VKQVPNGVQGVLKWFFSDQLINLGYNVLYMDTDSVALRDPFHEFVESDGYEFMAMSEQDTSPYNRRMDVLERKCPMFDFGGVDVYEEPVKLCASTRVFFLRATESTKILTKAMLAAMNGNTKENTWWEAKLVQKVALVYAWAEGWTPGLRIKILDLAKYCTVKVCPKQLVVGVLALQIEWYNSLHLCFAILLRFLQSKRPASGTVSHSLQTGSARTSCALPPLTDYKVATLQFGVR